MCASIIVSTKKLIKINKSCSLRVDTRRGRLNTIKHPPYLMDELEINLSSIGMREFECNSTSCWH